MLNSSQDPSDLLHPGGTQSSLQNPKVTPRGLHAKNQKIVCSMIYNGGIETV